LIAPLVDAKTSFDDFMRETRGQECVRLYIIYRPGRMLEGGTHVNTSFAQLCLVKEWVHVIYPR
jgi:hypothetical protein